MQKILVYDDTDDAIQKICEKLDLEEPDVVEYLLDVAIQEVKEIREAVDN